LADPFVEQIVATISDGTRWLGVLVVHGVIVGAPGN
jgi:hypothetical protein